MSYEDLSQFIKTTTASKSRIIRFYNKNPELKAETKMKGNKRMYPSDHNRYFNSEIMFDENQVLRLKNKSMKNLIDCLADKDSLQFNLWNQEWTYSKQSHTKPSATRKAVSGRCTRSLTV